MLLSQGKNMKAENFDFEDKKRRLFSLKDGISPFALTTQVLGMSCMDSHHNRATSKPVDHCFEATYGDYKLLSIVL